MPSKVYILGNTTNITSLSSQNKFVKAKKKLEEMNFKPFNPAYSFILFPESREKAIRHNLLGLLDSNAIYILKDSKEDLKNRVEVLMAMKLNLLIMHEF